MSFPTGRRGLALALLACAGAHAAEHRASPFDYESMLVRLQPGDTAMLSGGEYKRLVLKGIHGTPNAWIRIVGAPSRSPARIIGDWGSNAIEITNCSYLAIEQLTIDSLGIPGVFGISLNGANNISHDIRVEGNTFIGQNASQQTDGISTKAPTWGWIIRKNTIIGAGTGMYLGNSDGSAPFVAGLIENNLIANTTGYNMQIKHQNPRAATPGMPAGPSVTIIRDNVFIKDDRPSPDGDRPNFLLGGFPDSGPGSKDLYEVYGNVFYHNAREALLQVEGRVSVHDNIFVDGLAAAVFRTTHAPLKLAHVYNNTVYSRKLGIEMGSAASEGAIVTGNLVFAGTPIGGTQNGVSNNILDSFENARLYVASPSLTLGSMDFYPLPGKARGPAVNLAPFQTDTDYNVDFNGAPKAAAVFRGAYAGEGANPGWKIQSALRSIKRGQAARSQVPSAEGGILAQVAAYAGALLKTAPELRSRETLSQYSWGSAGRPENTPPNRTRTHEMTAEFAYGTLKNTPGHDVIEFRQIISIDGRALQTPEAAERALLADAKVGDERGRKRLLQEFTKRGFNNIATEYSLILLLFTGEGQTQLHIQPSGEERVREEDTAVFHWQQTSSGGGAVEFRSGKVTRRPLEGTLWVRKSDGFPLRVQVTLDRADINQHLRDEATVDYAPSGGAGPAPLAIAHRHFVNSQIVTENLYRYEPFRR